MQKPKEMYFEAFLRRFYGGRRRDGGSGGGVGGGVPLISFIIFVDHVLLQYSIQALCNI